MNVVTALLKSSLKPKPKIISLAECLLENGDWMEIKRFTCYASTKAEKYGCATYLKNEYVNMFVIHRITPHCVTLHTAGIEITIGYERLRAKNWDPQDEWHKGTENIIIGDLNVIHNTWSAGQRNTQGNLLGEWRDRRPTLEVINRYNITRTSTNTNHSSSTIDLVIANPASGTKVRHKIIASTARRALEIKTNLKWKESTEKPLWYDKVDWRKIEAGLALMDENNNDPTLLQDNLTRIILKHTPRASGKAKDCENKDLANLGKIILRMVAERRGGKDLVEARRKYTKAIAQAKMEANKKALEEETDPECFRTVKHKATKHPIPALQRADNTMAAEHDHIATEILDALNRGEHSRKEPGAITPTDPDIDEADIQKAFTASSNGAAPGPNYIPTRMISLMSKTKQGLLHKVINGVFKAGMPEQLKASSTILIPKANKSSYTIAQSWRPIQLQLILAKLMERIITDRLTNLNLLPDNMYGVRKGNGTTDAIQALDIFVTNNKHRNVCLTALDVEGGFDHLELDRTCNLIGRKNQHLGQWIRSWGSRC